MNLVQAALASQTRSARALSRDQLRALWSFRLSLISLKPGVDPEDDFSAFVREFDHDGLVWSLVEDGVVRGFHMQRYAEVDRGGRRHLALLPEYGFIDPDLRSHPILPLAVAWITSLCTLPPPGLPVVMAAGVYPASYIAYARAVRPLWTWGSPELTAEDRELLVRLGRRVAGAAFDPQTGTVVARTIPAPARQPASAEGRRLFSAYEQQNPDWQDGRMLFFLAPLSARTLARGAWHALERGGAVSPRSAGAPHPPVPAPPRAAGPDSGPPRAEHGT